MIEMCLICDGCSAVMAGWNHRTITAKQVRETMHEGYVHRYRKDFCNEACFKQWKANRE